MKEWVGGAFALGGVIVGAFLTNWLTYRRSTNEKLWHLRRESYGVILAELAGIDRICRAAEEYMTVYPDSARIRRPPLPNGAIRILPNG